MAASFIAPLDGLRAVAVISVLLYHGGQPWFRSGFIGVDVFFVISGFLITRNLATDIESGVMSVRRFYVRRIARLLPALYVTILCTVAAGIMVLSLAERANLGRSAIAAALSWGNILFWLDGGYFAPSATTKPLLHTWSLGVEEQFYLVWPLILVRLYAWSRAAAVWGCAAAGAGSLIAALVWYTADPSAVFYLMPFRVYQLATGALLALIGAPRPHTSASLVALAGVIGLIALAATGHGQAGVLLNGVAPTLAAAAFIAGAEGASVRRIFGSPVMGWIGRRSYSIYLVHWPLMVLWRLHWGSGGAVASWGLIAASLAGGAVMHAAVEQRFRLTSAAPAWRVRRAMTAVAVSLAAVLVAAGVPLLSSAPAPMAAAALPLPARAESAAPVGPAVVVLPPAAAVAPSRDEPVVPATVPSAALPTPDEVMRDTASHREQAAQARAVAVGMGACSFSSVEDASVAAYASDRCATGPDGRPRYLVLGDSWAGDTYLLLSRAYPDVYFGLLSVAGCRLRLPSHFTDGQQTGCRALYAYAFDTLVDRTRFDGVVLTSSWDPPYEQVAEMAEQAMARGLRAIVVGQHARFGRAVPDIVLSSSGLDEATRLAQRLVERFSVTQDAQLRAVLPPSVAFVDFLALHSRDGFYDIVDETGAVLYIDNTHLSMPGVALLATRMQALYPDLFHVSRRRDANR